MNTYSRAHGMDMMGPRWFALNLTNQGNNNHYLQIRIKLTIRGRD